MGGGNDNPAPPKPKPAPPPPTELISSAVGDASKQRSAQIAARGTFLTKGQKLGSSGEVLGSGKKQLANVADKLILKEPSSEMSINSYLKSNLFKDTLKKEGETESFINVYAPHAIGSLKTSGTLIGDFQRRYYEKYVTGLKNKRAVIRQQNQQLSGTSGMST
tara:strand:- start:1676 stop:2164 length:489 start_codon:yes stop_codon:yes gene_type:complete